MNWDVFQRQVLAELGHVLMVPRGVDQPQDMVANVPAQPMGEDEPLLKHLLRAAGRDASRIVEVMAVVQSLDGLRGNAAAKRALWPLLRALRRS